MRCRTPQRANHQRLFKQREKAFLVQNPVCPVILFFEGIKIPATGVHHAKRNMGKLLLDERFWLQVSIEGHVMCEQTHVKECRRLGFNLTRGYCPNDDLELSVLNLRRNLDFTPVKEYDELVAAVYPEFEKC